MNENHLYFCKQNYILKSVKKILFVAHHRIDRAPGQRYRFEQYFDYLKLKGINCDLANWMNEKNDKVLRKRVGNEGRKTVLEKYSKNIVKQTYHDLYTSLMK